MNPSALLKDEPQTYVAEAENGVRILFFDPLKDYWFVMGECLPPACRHSPWSRRLLGLFSKNKIVRRVYRFIGTQRIVRQLRSRF